MPSGHGGGSSGSHFGGGFSGGSHFGGGSSSGRHLGGSGYHRTTIFIGGRSYYSEPGTFTSVFLSAIFAFITLIICVVSIMGAGENSNRIKYITEDNAYYLQMIDDSVESGRIDTQAKVTNVVYNEEYDRYYITYTFTNESGEIEGYSFSIYKTKLTAPQVFNGTNYISVAFDNETAQADSIPVDYKNFTLSDDGEYLTLTSRRTISYCVGAVCGGISVICIVLAIVLGIKTYKDIKSGKIQLKPVDGKPENVSNTATAEDVYCPYCGSKIFPGDKKCLNCGAGLKNK